MSFILEALRRAEAQRQRGGVPGLHAQPAAAALADLALAHQIRARRPWRLVFALASVLLLLAAAARWWLGPSGLSPTLSAAPPPSVAPAAEPALAAPLAVSVTLAPIASAAAAHASRQPPPVAPSVGLPLIAAPLYATASSPAAARPSLSASAPPSAPSSASRWPTLAELPETLRRELPVLALGGSVYAEQASQRMVIINGQVLREGDRLAPELLLQQIRLKSVLLDYRGQRFELPF